MATRKRRTPDEAKSMILDHAASLLSTGGVNAVQVRAIARNVGMTDAGINHHFGSRDHLLEALLRRGGKELRDQVLEVTEQWLENEADIGQLVRALSAIYERGYGELAVALHNAGWRDTGEGILNPVVDALHTKRNASPRPRKEDTRIAVAALHQALALDPTYGAAFRRSAGIREANATNNKPQLQWWVTTAKLALGIS